MRHKEQKSVREQLAEMYLFWFLMFGAIWAYLMPYLMDYYCLRDSHGFSFFYEYHIVGNIEVLLSASAMIFLVYLFVYALSLRMDVSVGVTSVLLVILSYASRLKYLARGEMLNWRDLFVTEAKNLAEEHLAWDFSGYFWMLVVVMLLMVGLGYGVEWLGRPWKMAQTKKKKTWFRWGAVLISVGGALTLWLTVVRTISAQQQWQGERGERREPCVVFDLMKENGFAGDEGDPEEALAWLEQEAQNGPERTDTSMRPNVICIMNESWWNTAWLTDDVLSCSQDPMEPYRKLAEECVSGDVSVNIYGGGTFSSEMEYAMGVNVNYLSSSVGLAYELPKLEKISSIADYFLKLNYQTLFIHPYDGDFYRRRDIYQKMGFEKMVFQEDMKYTELYDAYISDNALADQIVYEYENKKEGQPLYLWSVSVAGHEAGMDEEHPLLPYEYPIQLDFSGTKLQGDTTAQGKLTREVNAAYLSTRAYQKLVDYFSKVDEPTVILMYGDHNPGVIADADQLLHRDGIKESFEDVYHVYTSPVLLWKNYDEGEPVEDFAGQNVQYLSAALVQYAGLPDCTMTSILRRSPQILRAFSAKYTLDAEGKMVTNYTEEQKNLLTYGRVLQNQWLLREGAPRNLWAELLTGADAH